PAIASVVVYFVLFLYVSAAPSHLSSFPTRRSSDLMGDLGDLTNQQDPAEQLKMFQEFVSDFDFEQTEDEFILKLTADGEEFTSVMREMAKESMPPEIAEGMAEEGLDVFEQMDINNMS